MLHTATVNPAIGLVPHPDSLARNAANRVARTAVGLGGEGNAWIRSRNIGRRMSRSGRSAAR